MNSEQQPSETAAASLQSHEPGVTDSPLRVPNLSTSTTSSFEALDPHDPSLSRMATKMFQKSNEYISHELNTCLEDYKLLEDLNKVTMSKYSDMNQIADNLIESSEGLRQKYEEFVSSIDQQFTWILLIDFSLTRCHTLKKLMRSKRPSTI